MKLKDLFKHANTEAEDTEQDVPNEVWVRKGDKMVKVEGDDENAKEGK